MPAPPPLTANDLAPGRSYLHTNGLFIRHIDAIDGDAVHYHDQYGQGSCTRAAFLKACPSLASPEAVAAARESPPLPTSPTRPTRPTPPSSLARPKFLPPDQYRHGLAHRPTKNQKN